MSDRYQVAHDEAGVKSDLRSASPWCVISGWLSIEALVAKTHQRIRERQQIGVAAFSPTPIGAIMSIMPDRPTKITFAEMRDNGVLGAGLLR
jgi:hypothetical protein